MNEHTRTAPRVDSAVWGIVAAVALIVFGTLAQAWPITVLGGVALIGAIAALVYLKVIGRPVHDGRPR